LRDEHQRKKQKARGHDDRNAHHKAFSFCYGAWLATGHEGVRREENCQLNGFSAHARERKFHHGGTENHRENSCPPCFGGECFSRERWRFADSVGIRKGGISLPGKNTFLTHLLDVRLPGSVICLDQDNAGLGGRLAIEIRSVGLNENGAVPAGKALYQTAGSIKIHP
jgi:hypothetical protein